MLPEGWSTSLLDQITKRGSGHTPNKEHPEYWNGGIKWVSLADSSKLDQRLVTTTDKEISALGMKHSSAVLHPGGTVILSRDAGVGKSAVLGSEMAVSQHFIVWRCDEYKRVHNWFLYYWLQQKKPFFERMAVGSTIKTIGLPLFKKLAITHPSYSEQKKIAEILSTWDAAIETTGKLLANAEAQKRALMQQLLTGKRRLKGFEGREWAKTTLGDMLEIHYGKSPTDIAADDGAYPIVGTGGVTGTTHRWHVEGPAVVIGRKGTIDKPTMLTGRFWPIDTTYYCKAKKGYLLDWVYQVLKTVRWRRYNEASGVPSLSRETIRTIPIRAPSTDEQQAITSILQHADKDILSLEQSLGFLEFEKRALMQQLLTGKRRVTV
jgi:type I restriction enzyme, S subunit